MGRLRFGSGEDFADLSHNPTLARCHARSLTLISCSLLLTRPETERERVCVAAEGNYKIACEMRGPLMMIVLVSGPLTPLGNDNTDSSTDTVSHTRPQITEIDHKLRLIMS